MKNMGSFDLFFYYQLKNKINKNKINKKMDKENLKNPYVGVFPTRKQHAEVMKSFLNNPRVHLPDLNKQYLIDNIENYQDINYYEWVERISNYNNTIQKIILNEYEKIGFPSHNRGYYYDQNVEVIGNFDNFKARVSHSDDKSNQEWSNDIPFSFDIKIEPGIFHMGEMFLDDEDNNKMISHLLTQGISDYVIEDGRLNRKSVYTTHSSPKVGWTKSQLTEALSDAGIFDATVEDTGIIAKKLEYTWARDYSSRKIEVEVEVDVKLYKHTYPNLIKFGIPGEYYHGSKIQKYDMINMHKYKLENLYRLIFKPKPDWELCCSHPLVDGKSLAIEYQRREGVKFPTTDKSIICNLLSRPQLYREIPEISQQLIFQPPSKTAAGIQYQKYLNEKTLGEFKPVESVRTISMSAYDKFYDMCSDPNRDRFSALIHAIELGLEIKLSENMTKEEICNSIRRYLKMIREGRKL